MEHWHNSPKKLFHEVMAKLKKGGIFILSSPNCHNLRKRISVPLGYGKWSSMEGWYEEEKFRGQGINDLIVFSTMALGSLSAGVLLSLTSWTTMNLICIPFLVLIIYSTFRANKINQR